MLEGLSEIQRAHPNLILEAMREISKEQEFKFKSRPKELGGYNEWDQIDCALNTPKFNSSFNLQQCPGCCAVLIVSYMRLDPWTKGNFDEALKIIEQAAFQAGFGSVLMTQVVGNYSKMFWKNESWIKCLDRGWVSAPPFMNAKSGNIVVYLTKDLGQRVKRVGLEVIVPPKRS